MAISYIRCLKRKTGDCELCHAHELNFLVIGMCLCGNLVVTETEMFAICGYDDGSVSLFRLDIELGLFLEIADIPLFGKSGTYAEIGSTISDFS